MGLPKITIEKAAIGFGSVLVLLGVYGVKLGISQSKAETKKNEAQAEFYKVAANSVKDGGPIPTRF